MKYSQFPTVFWFNKISSYFHHLHPHCARLIANALLCPVVYFATNPATPIFSKSKQLLHVLIIVSNFHFRFFKDSGPHFSKLLLSKTGEPTAYSKGGTFVMDQKDWKDKVVSDFGRTYMIPFQRHFIQEKDFQGIKLKKKQVIPFLSAKNATEELCRADFTYHGMQLLILFL